MMSEMLSNVPLPITSEYMGVKDCPATVEEVVNALQRIDKPALYDNKSSRYPAPTFLEMARRDNPALAQVLADSPEASEAKVRLELLAAGIVIDQTRNLARSCS